MFMNYFFHIGKKKIYSITHLFQNSSGVTIVKIKNCAWMNWLRSAYSIGMRCAYMYGQQARWSMGRTIFVNEVQFNSTMVWGNMLYSLNSLKLLQLVLWARIWSIWEKVHMHMKIMHLLQFGCSVLKIVTNSFINVFQVYYSLTDYLLLYQLQRKLKSPNIIISLCHVNFLKIC